MKKSNRRLATASALRRGKVRIAIDEVAVQALVHKHIIGDASLDEVRDFILDYEALRARPAKKAVEE